MYQVMNLTKKKLQELQEPLIVMAGPEKAKEPIAVIVPYELYLSWQPSQPDRP